MHALQRQNADPPKVRAAPGDGGGRCLWAKSFPILTSGRNTLVVSGKGGFFQELGHCPLFGLLWAALEFVVAPTGVSFSVLICYNKSTMRLKCWNSNLLPSWPLVSFNQFLSYPQWSCHSFTGCTLTPSLLSHVQAHSDCLQVK